MNEKARHKRAYSILRVLATPFFKWKFNYQYPIVDSVEGPYIVLANHNSDLDGPLVGLAFPKQMYFVVSEHITRMGILSWFIMRYIKPIIRVKGKVEVKTVSEILRTVRGGDNVCIFAEGARSFNGQTRPILSSTGKMVKRSGAALVTYRLEGGYFSQPRWGTTFRRGKVTGTVAGFYTAEDLKAMTEDQVNEIIKTDLFEDAYETQKRERIPFKGKKLALGMESTLFLCPNCNKIGTLKSDDTSITCECGLHYTYTKYGDLETKDGETYSITEWDLWQQKELTNRFHQWKEKGIETPCLSDKITLLDINSDHQIVAQEEGSMVAYLDRLECCGHTFYFEEMLGFDIVSRNRIIMNYGKDAHHYEMKGDIGFNALKYLYFYQLVKGVEL